MYSGLLPNQVVAVTSRAPKFPVFVKSNKVTLSRNLTYHFVGGKYGIIHFSI